jgi:NAD(P)-dependent dehydrogenase (short-subunit alcohol dehydrogenase family)
MIKDKVVVIAGHRQGHGPAACRKRRTAIVPGARREANPKRIADAIRQAGGEAAQREPDVTRQANDDAVAKLARATFGRVAGIIIDACLNGRVSPAASLTP